MRIMYTFGGGVAPRCHVDIRVTYVTPATMPTPKGTVPILILEYGIGELGAVAVIAREMTRKREVPEIYIWNTHLPEPEVAVRFATGVPTAAVLTEITGKVGEVPNAMVAELGCSSVFTLAEVNLDQQQVTSLLLHNFRTTKVAGVFICETGQPKTQPLFAFTTSQLNEQPLSLGEL